MADLHRVGCRRRPPAPTSTDGGRTRRWPSGGPIPPAAGSELLADFAAVWQAADKIVYSTTLDAVSTTRSRLERRFDADPVRRLKDTSGRDLTVGGPNLAAHAFRPGLIDECHLFVWPVVVGRGKRSLRGDRRGELELLDERRFDNGVVYLLHRIPN